MRIIACLLICAFFTQCNESHKEEHPENPAKVAMTEVQETPPGITDKKWILKSLNDSTIGMVNNQTPYIEFIDSAKRVNAYAGCNRMSGSFSLTENGIKFEQMLSTKMACPDMITEDMLSLALSQTNAYKVVNDTLHLLHGEMPLAKFTTE